MAHVASVSSSSLEVPGILLFRKHILGGQGDFVIRFITPVTRIATPTNPIIRPQTLNPKE